MTWHNMKNSFTRRLARLAFAVILLLATGLTAEAQQYVFMYKNGDTYNFLSKNTSNANAIANTQTFNDATCVFTRGADGNYWTFVNDGYYLRPRNTKDNDYTLNLSNSTNNTARRCWTNGSNGRIHYNNYYLNYDGGWKVTSTTSPGTGAARTVLFAYSAYEKSLDDPTITGDAVLSAARDYDYSVAATFHPAFSQFDGYSGTNTVSYYHNGSSMTTTKPSNTNVTTGTWTLEGGSTYASVNTSTGEITISSLPANDLTMTLKCQVTSNSLTKTAEKTILLYGTTIATPTIHSH